MTLDLQPATPDMAPVASALIYLTMGKMADYLFGLGNAQNAQKLLTHLFRRKSNRFSYQFTKVPALSNEVVGLVISYSGRLMKSLEFPTAVNLVQERGVIEFNKFIKRALPLWGVKEAENDEYFISNIAVLPAYQGQGIGKFLLYHTEETASKQGFKKISLTVDVKNEHAFRLYKKLGYKVIETIHIDSVPGKMEAGGFHRMVKILA
ncbi:MAG: N-acetyltransferase [Pelolinea sp.]|nr:N-acetyltransferase [Pelolinea sp.]